MSVDGRPVIELSDVSAGYGDVSVLERLNFQVRYGEFVYMVGKTGSGKSTLLKLIYADQIPWTGEIRVGDIQVHHIQRRQVPQLRRKLGIIFQDYQLLPDRSAYENIRFALQATGWRDKNRIRQRISEVLVRVGMSGKAASWPHQLSGGEQQRVVIARALINDPIILIADEPTGNLDPEATEQIMEILQRINMGGTAVLMATHEHSLLKSHPSRVIEIVRKNMRDFPNSEAFIAEKYY
jgi:cell division transport system ATP-binding protein